VCINIADEGRRSRRPRPLIKHLSKEDRQRVRTLYFEARLSRREIELSTGFSRNQIEHAFRAPTANILPRFGRPTAMSFEQEQQLVSLVTCYGLVAEGRHRCARPMPLASARTRAQARPNPASPLGNGSVFTLANPFRRVPRDFIVVFPFFFLLI
jgi:hypothetical protein